MKPVEIFGFGVILYALFSRRSDSSIGAIFDEVPALFECNDGSYSTNGTGRACSWHGGLKSKIPVQLSENYSGLINIRDVPIDQILINTKLFQGRQKEYSERSVENIVNDVRAGKFLWENLDPITLWKDSNGKLFLLSGHSRLEAFRRLQATGETSGGKGFGRIPAKIMNNVPVDIAKKVALESNTLSTKETDIERATYYRKLRQEGAQEKTIRETIQKNEGKNWNNIYSFTFLSPNGATWQTLRQFGEGEDNSATIAKSLARWIGQARRQFPTLTNEHEAELYAWLFEDSGYGAGPRQVNSEGKFLEKVQEFTFGLDPSQPLNIKGKMQRTPVQMQYDEQVQAAEKEVTEAQRELNSEIRRLAQAGADKKTVQQLTIGLETRLRNARVDLQKLLSKRQEILEYAQNEPRLFGIKHTFNFKKHQFV